MTNRGPSLVNKSGLTHEEFERNELMKRRRFSARTLPPLPFYNGPEHESLLAIGRCLRLHVGPAEAGRRFVNLLAQFNVTSVFHLSPFGANFCRKILEKQLPLRGDY